MKKILFFLFCLFLPTFVSAESITDLQVLNGTLSIPFNKDNILNSDNSEENYVFYINKKEETTPVFKETNVEEEKQKEIPHLKLYVSLACFFIIVSLFKIIVL